jgi:hemolysin activation/secretion protein
MQGLMQVNITHFGEAHGLRPVSILAAVGLGAALLWPTHAGAQVTQADLQRDAQEQRRAQEREQQLRSQQERSPDVHLPAAAPTAGARLVTDVQPCFVIRRIALQGDTAGRFSWLMGALAGPKKDDSPLDRCLGTTAIGQLLQRGQDALVARGFVTTRLLATPQDLSSGTLTLTVVPGKLEALRFEPSADGKKPGVRLGTVVPAKPGDIVNLRDIEQGLENLKRVPTAEADIQIAPGSQPDHSDLVVRYQAGFPLRLSFSVDDSGGKTTGVYQGSATLSWDNALGLSDLLYLTHSQDLGGGEDGPRGTSGDTVHYSLPWGYWTVGATASNSRYHQNVAGLTQDYVYSGTSENAELKVSRMVYRDAVRKTSASVKAWQRKSNNFIDDTEVQIQRRLVGGWELGVSHKDALGDASIEGNVAYKFGTGDFGSLPAPEESLGTGTSMFSLIAMDVTVGLPFKLLDTSLRYSGTLRAQFHGTPLTPQDRFAIGGRYTVRGFDGASSLAGESGWLIRNELSTALGNSGHQLYAGLDVGQVEGPSTAQLIGQSLAGAVVGLRGSFWKFQYDLFIGTPVSKPDGFHTAEGTAGFSLNLSF